MSRRTHADRLKTFRHRKRSGSRIPPGFDRPEVRVEISPTWLELMATLIARLEARDTPPHARDEIRAELFRLARAMDELNERKRGHG
jgi:truncated hemoglobin YjbI